jgi:hypothetical protein
MLNKKQSDLLVCSFRYALGRTTAMVSTIVDYLIDDWSYLEPWQHDQIKKDINNAIVANRAGENCDVNEWRRVLEL